MIFLKSYCFRKTSLECEEWFVPQQLHFEDVVMHLALLGGGYLPDN